MLVCMDIENLAVIEKSAHEVLEHVEAIKKLVRDSGWTSIQVNVSFADENDQQSGG